MDRLAATIQELDRLVAFPTVSADSNLAIIAHMAAVLAAAGARIEVQRNGDGTKANLFATLGPAGSGGVVLSGHSDVVPVTDQIWSSDPFTLTRRGDRLYGRGTCDMKGFLAACLVMAPVFAAEKLRQPLHFAFTHDEETGCIGGRHLTETLARAGLTPAIALVGEPTMMGLIDGHKGCCEYSVRLTGLEGHGSAPDRGVNAAEYAVRYVTELLRLRDALKHRAPADSPYDPPWTTINIGRISGGVAHNVIPGLAEVDWDLRPVQDADFTFVHARLATLTDTLQAEMRATHPDADIETTTIGEVRGLIPTRSNAARDLIARLTGANRADVVSFGTEAGLFQAIGTDTVICGPGAIAQAHKPDEYVEIAQLSACLDLLAALADLLHQN